MMKSYVFVLIYLLSAAAPAAGQTINIDSCYALALRNYPLIRQYELIEKTKEYTLSNASKAYLPQVSLTAIEGYIFGGLPDMGSSGSSSNFKFIGLGQVNQMIWDGGATKTQKKIINAQTETEKANLDVALHELHTRVNQLFFGILLVDEQLKQLAVQNSILSNNVDRIKQLNENGLAYKTDLDEIRVEQLKLSEQKAEFEYTRDGYILMLSLLIGTKINDQTTLQKPAPIAQPSNAEILRPELGLYKSQRALIQAQSGIQRVNLMPKLGLLGAGVVFAPGISLGNASLSSIGVAGLSASWNINGLYKNSNEKNLTVQSLQKIDVAEETFLFNTRLQLTQASSNIQKQKAILLKDEEIVSLRKTIREAYQIKYNSGAGPLIELLNATEKESEARAQKALHEMQLLMTLFEYTTISGN